MIAFLFIVFHFSFIFFYAAPEGVFSDKVKKMATSYVYPVFRQNWSLFAPCPVINSYTEIAFEFDNQQTDWIRVGRPFLKKHSFTRGLHYGELVLIESNLMYAVNHDLEELGVRVGESKMPFELKGYNKIGYSGLRIRKYLLGYALLLYGKKPSKGYFRCWRKDVASGQEGIVELPFFSFK